MSVSTSVNRDASYLYYVFDGLIAARTLYGFFKSYFQKKFERQQQQQQGKQGGKDVAILENGKKRDRPIRVYMDGCFDCMHFGHANALRQARALGDILVVGINPDYEIVKHKGPPVMSNKERYVAVESVKWVDEILTDVPYEVTSEFLERLIKEHDIDYIVHGDDPCIGRDGQDVYKAVKEMGKFRMIKRTEGVSSTDIVGRILLCTREHHLDSREGESFDELPNVSSSSLNSKDIRALAEGRGKGQGFTRVSTFLPTTRRLIQFAGDSKAPRPGDKVVYVDGTFDMFHCGHIETLKAARKLGDFLLVGIHDDATVNAHKGRNFPIMNLHERTLSVLSCKYVDEVIIGAPWAVTMDMIKTMNISLVVHGTHFDDDELTETQVDIDPYSLPRKLGIYQEVKSKSNLTVVEIAERIVQNREAYEERNKKKVKSEKAYLENHKVYREELLHYKRSTSGKPTAES